MGIKELGISILEYFIANIPTIIILVVSTIKSFRNIRGKLDDKLVLLNGEVAKFDSSIVETEKNIVKATKEQVEEVFKNVNNHLENTIDRVDGTLDKIGGKVDTFSNELFDLKTQVEHLFKTNKIALEIISSLVGDDAKLIDNGVANTIVNKVNFTKEELEKYPEKITTDTKVFAKAIKEQYILLGEEKILEILEQAKKEIENVKNKKEEKL